MTIDTDSTHEPSHLLIFSVVRTVLCRHDRALTYYFAGTAHSLSFCVRVAPGDRQAN